MRGMHRRRKCNGAVGEADMLRRAVDCLPIFYQDPGVPGRVAGCQIDVGMADAADTADADEECNSC